MKTLTHYLEHKRQNIEEKLGYEVDFNISAAIDYLRLNFDINASDTEYLGSGNNGKAYGEKKSIGEARVVKLTEDYFEVQIAEKLLGKKNEYLADIYGVYHIYDKYYLIVQEKLEIKHPLMIEARDYMLEILDDKNLCMQEIVIGENIESVIKESDNCENEFLGEWCYKYCIDIVKAAYKAFEECEEKTGIESEDFHLFNMGVKANGNIGFFDQTQC